MKEYGANVGKTTIYRYLEQLANEGVVRKYRMQDGTCYQYQDDLQCREHHHLKCLYCGELIHLECAQLRELEKHVQLQHGFQIDNTQTVLYGMCENCRKQRGKEE